MEAILVIAPGGFSEGKMVLKHYTCPWQFSPVPGNVEKDNIVFIAAEIFWFIVCYVILSSFWC